MAHLVPLPGVAPRPGPEFVAGAVAFLRSDPRGKTPMTVRGTFREQGSGKWFVTCRWHTNAGDIIEDDFAAAELRVKRALAARGPKE